MSVIHIHFPKNTKSKVLVEEFLPCWMTLNSTQQSKICLCTRYYRHLQKEYKSLLILLKNCTIWYPIDLQDLFAPIYWQNNDVADLRYVRGGNSGAVPPLYQKVMLLQQQELAWNVYWLAKVHPKHDYYQLSLATFTLQHQQNF